MPTVTGAPSTGTAQITLGSVEITLEAGDDFDPNDLARVIESQVQATFLQDSELQGARVLVVAQVSRGRSLTDTRSRSLATITITFIIYIVIDLQELERISVDTGISVNDLFAEVVTLALDATDVTLSDTTTLENIISNEFGIVIVINEVITVTEPPITAPPIPSPRPVVVSTSPSESPN